MMRLRRLKIYLFSCLLPLLVIPSSLRPAALPLRQEPPIRYLRYDVEINLKPDGNFIVREIQQIQFEGNYHTAFAKIPRAYTEDIKNIYLWEDDSLYRQESRARSR